MLKVIAAILVADDNGNFAIKQCVDICLEILKNLLVIRDENAIIDENSEFSLVDKKQIYDQIQNDSGIILHSIHSLMSSNNL